MIWILWAVWLGLSAEQPPAAFAATLKHSASAEPGGARLRRSLDRLPLGRSNRGEDQGLLEVSPHQLAAVHGSHICAKANGPSPEAAEHETMAPGVEAGMFLATAEPDVILTSPNARLWCLQASEARPDCHRVVGGNGILVRVGPRSGLETSNDGVSWTRRNCGVPNRLYAAAFGNGLFVAVGNEGALVTSADGVKWKPRNSRTDERLRGIVFGQGRFIVVGYEGTVVSSSNGRHWRRRRSGTDERLLDVACGRGLFVAVGWHGTVLTSHNAVRWTPRNLGTSLQLRSIVFGTDPLLATEPRAEASSH